MIHASSCPLCGHESAGFKLSRTDGLPVNECPSCGLIFVPRVPFESRYGDMEGLYGREYFDGGGDIGYENYTGAPLADMLWQRAFVELVKNPDGASILDVGCGTGRLLELLRARGAGVTGVEISEYAASVAASKGLDVITGGIDAVDGTGRFDIITAFDVIEHVPDLEAFAAKVHSLLKDNGVFVFMTPDAGSERAIISGSGWSGYGRSLEHIYYFTLRSIGALLSRAFGHAPALFQAAAEDGDGIAGFIRKIPSKMDEGVLKTLRDLLTSGLAGPSTALQAAILLWRLNDPRLADLIRLHRDAILDKAGPEEMEALGLRRDTVFRPYMERDEQGITSLFREVFGKEMTVDQWKWKYRPPWAKTVYVSVMEDEGGRVVGHYGGTPLRALLRGSETVFLTLGDAMVHPSKRGFWAPKKLIRELKRFSHGTGVSWGYGFPPEDVMRLYRALKVSENCLEIREAGKSAVFNSGIVRYLYKMLPVHYDDPDIDALWEGMKPHVRLGVVRDSAFLKWRYRDNPFLDYELWGMRRRWGGRMVGLAVLRRDEDCVLVMDLLFGRGLLVPLLKKIENCAVSSGAGRLRLWLPGRYQGDLERAGYAFSRFGDIAYASGEEFINSDEVAESLYFTMGDTDFL